MFVQIIALLGFLRYTLKVRVACHNRLPGPPDYPGKPVARVVCAPDFISPHESCGVSKSTVIWQLSVVLRLKPPNPPHFLFSAAALQAGIMAIAETANKSCSTCTGISSLIYFYVPMHLYLHYLIERGMKKHD